MLHSQASLFFRVSAWDAAVDCNDNLTDSKRVPHDIIAVLCQTHVFVNKQTDVIDLTGLLFFLQYKLHTVKLRFRSCKKKKK